MEFEIALKLIYSQNHKLAELLNHKIINSSYHYFYCYSDILHTKNSTKSFVLIILGTHRTSSENTNIHLYIYHINLFNSKFI